MHLGSENVDFQEKGVFLKQLVRGVFMEKADLLKTIAIMTSQTQNFLIF